MTAERTWLYVFVATFYLAWALAGTAAHLGLGGSPLATGLSFALPVLATLIASMDALTNRKPLPRVVPVVVFFTWPVSLPVCLARSRGWRGLVWFAVHLAGILYLLVMVSMVLTWVFGIEAKWLA